MTTAQHLDAALEHLRAIGHESAADALTRQHVEHAAAHIREAWLADDDQTARTPEDTSAAVSRFYRLQTALLAKATA